MSSNRTRWRVIPETRKASALWLLVGLLVLGNAVWQWQDSTGTPPLLVVSTVLAAAVIVMAVIGLVRPGLRGR